MTNRKMLDRRRVLVGAGSMGLAFVAPRARAQERIQEDDVGPGEDLMREHGVLRRVLLVYGEIRRRIEVRSAFDVEALRKTAELVRAFVEDYHERQEEEVVFPRFERAKKLADLVRVLRMQHQAGRKLTDRILGLTTGAALKDLSRRFDLRAALGSFSRMYEPHAAREDTVLFPALHDVVSRAEYDAMGDELERRERAAFGGDGFEAAVAQIDAIEKTFAINALERFTPVG